MNSFGRYFRLSIFGESHGAGVGIIVDGCPPGIALDPKDFLTDLSRRQGGLTPGTTTRVESDIPQFISGVFNGFTTGSPITLFFENTNTRGWDYEKNKEIPRPGHADFVSQIRFKGYQDYRGGGHFSGRLTVAFTAAGVIAKKVIDNVYSDTNKIIFTSDILEVGGDKNISLAIQSAMENNDSIGGVVQCVVRNLPIGLGDPFFDSLESLISHAIFSIPAIKGIEFGSGFASARMKGSDHNDTIIDTSGKTNTNNAGGIVGGLSNGNDLVFRVAVKPTSSTPASQLTLNMKSNQIDEFKIEGRHDLCIALRVPVVLEAATACVIADMLMLHHTNQ